MKATAQVKAKVKRKEAKRSNKVRTRALWQLQTRSLNRGRRVIPNISGQFEQGSWDVARGCSFPSSSTKQELLSQLSTNHFSARPDSLDTARRFVFRLRLPLAPRSLLPSTEKAHARASSTSFYSDTKSWQESLYIATVTLSLEPGLLPAFCTSERTLSSSI